MMEWGLERGADVRGCDDADEGTIVDDKLLDASCHGRKGPSPMRCLRTRR